MWFNLRNWFEWLAINLTCHRLSKPLQMDYLLVYTKKCLNSINQPPINKAEHKCTHGGPGSIPMGILLFATSTWILKGSIIWVTHTHGSITHRCMGTHGLFLYMDPYRYLQGYLWVSM